MMTEEPEVFTTRRQLRAASRDQRPRRRGMRTLVTLLVGLAVVAAALVIAWPMVSRLVDGGPAAEDFPGPGSGEVIVEIPSGATGGDIGTILVESNVVASRQAFFESFNANPNAASIQAGSYRLKEEMKAADAVTALLDPLNRAEVTITVPEGFTAAQVYARIENAMGIPLADVQAAAADPAAIGLPAEAGGNPEGWLSPLTYSFAPTATAVDVLSTMVQRTVGDLDALGVPAEQRQVVLTKASIVEREGLPQYFGQVARVIENRLMDPSADVGGRLQMDSTVLYGLGQVGGVPTQEQLDTDTPFNTYLHPGLPPSPIGSPSRAAIEAVVNPPAGDWLYFVTVNLSTGETKFASTLAEHLRNVEEFRQWRAENPDVTAAED